jgi:acetoacetyl-CoA synthetase
MPSHQPLWKPSSEGVAQSNLTEFIKAVSLKRGRTLSSYAELHAWSVNDIAEFWNDYAHYAGFDFKSTNIVQHSMPYTKWFEGATLNYAQELLYPRSLEDAEQAAIIAVTETGHEHILSYKELREAVSNCAATLQRDGIGQGDRVAAFACNIPETVIVLLACAAIGALFSSCSPDFGFEAALARFAQIDPKLLFASSIYYYGGKKFDTSSTIKQLSEKLSSLEKIILLPYPDVPANNNWLAWDEWLESNLQPVDKTQVKSASFNFEPLSFDHPLYILYSSGTTGLPKAMVHRAGGALLQHHKEHHLHCDIKPKDVVLYFSTCGWMMWNWLVSALAQAATIVLYEGSPAQPNLNVLWNLAEKYRFTFFGTSARYLHTLQAQNFSSAGIDLSSLRTIASTGSPLSPSAFEYVYKNIKEDVHLASISGGTDIVSCFMVGVPTEPVYAGFIQAPGLGVDLAAFDDNGQAVTQQTGELVCRQPLPSMPLKFWNDPDFSRYNASYFDVYPGVWRHGDLIEQTPQGLLVYGRSDATLNPGGVRIGTAEIYRTLERFPEIIEACAVAKKTESDEDIWLFVVLSDGAVLNTELTQAIKTEIRQKASPRHVPRAVFQVSQLPRTRSGKSMEIAVSKLVNAQAIPNREVMANPESLDEISRVLEQYHSKS